MKESITINKYSKSIAILISYEEFSKFEDMYWKIQAENAAEEGFLSEDDSEDFLNKILIL